jgi:hypothetical protein
MTTTRGGSTPPARATAARRPTGVATMIALQRSAGNGSTLALLRRAHQSAEEAPIMLTLPGVVDGAAVSTWNLEQDMRGSTSGLTLTRPVDANSPILAKALFDGAPDVEGRLVVRKLTPLGWVRELTLTMEGCTVASYHVHENYESVHLTFSRLHIDQ